VDEYIKDKINNAILKYWGWNYESWRFFNVKQRYHLFR
jgi:hypothetical protein